MTKFPPSATDGRGKVRASKPMLALTLLAPLPLPRLTSHRICCACEHIQAHHMQGCSCSSWTSSSTGHAGFEPFRFRCTLSALLHAATPAVIVCTGPPTVDVAGILPAPAPPSSAARSARCGIPSQHPCCIGWFSLYTGSHPATRKLVSESPGGRRRSAPPNGPPFPRKSKTAVSAVYPLMLRPNRTTSRAVGVEIAGHTAEPARIPYPIPKGLRRDGLRYRPE